MHCQVPLRRNKLNVYWCIASPCSHEMERVALCSVMCSHQGLFQIGSQEREVFLLHITFGLTHAPPSPIYVQSRHEICTICKWLWRWCGRINQMLPTGPVQFSTLLLVLASTVGFESRGARPYFTVWRVTDSNWGTWSSHEVGSNRRKWRPCLMWAWGSTGPVGITR
jgi:hypothetical protein